MADHEEDASLSDGVKHRRNLVLAASFTLILVFTAIDFSSVSILGVSLSGVKTWKIHVIVVVWLVYAWLRYCHARTVNTFALIMSDASGYLLPRLRTRYINYLNKRVRKIAEKDGNFTFLTCMPHIEFREGVDPTWNEIPIRVGVTYKQDNVDYFKDKGIDLTVGSMVGKWLWTLSISRSLVAKPAFLEHLFPHVLAALALGASVLAWDLLWGFTLLSLASEGIVILMFGWMLP